MPVLLKYLTINFNVNTNTNIDNNKNIDKNPEKMPFPQIPFQYNIIIQEIPKYDYCFKITTTLNNLNQFPEEESRFRIYSNLEGLLERVKNNKYIEFEYNKNHNKSLVFEQFYETFQEISFKKIMEISQKVIKLNKNLNAFFTVDDPTTTIKDKDLNLNLNLNLNPQKSQNFQNSLISSKFQNSPFPQREKKKKGKIHSIIGFYIKDEAYILKIKHS